MCKVLIIAGVKPEHSDKAERFVKAARKYMTKTDSHAFGYAALSDGGLFGEKWTAVGEAFKDWTGRKRAFQAMAGVFGDAVRLPNRDGEYSSYGKRRGAVSAWICHARFATVGPRTVQNAHPFFRNGHALIHNGGITNHEFLRKISSECDSETILNAYVDRNVADDPTKIADVAAVLQGWYACGVLAPTANGYVVDVFRDGMADLVAAYIPAIECIAIATKREILKGAARDSGLAITQYTEVPRETLFRLDARTGERIAVARFERAAYSFEFDTKRSWKKSGSVHYRSKRGGAYPVIPGYVAPETAEDSAIESAVAESVSRAESFSAVETNPANANASAVYGYGDEESPADVRVPESVVDEIHAESDEPESDDTDWDDNVRDLIERRRRSWWRR